MKIVADENIPYAAECFCRIGDVEVLAGCEITPSAVGDANVLLVRSVTRVDSDLLAESSVRFVGTATIGFEHIDVEYLSRKNIGFASAPGSNANSTAEYVIAGLLEIGRKHNLELEGKSIGIIGVGNVGSRVAKKCAALGMGVLLNDPPLQRETGSAKYLPLEKLFGCDFITLHTPLTFEGIDRTFHLADERFFKLLKAGCVFFNTSRGGVVETIALKAAIKSGRLKAVVLDVWENEPSIDTGLLEMVDIGTPHIAGYSLDGKVAGMIMVYKAVCEYFGFSAEFDVKSFLPDADLPQLEVKAKVGTEQQVLLEAVERIYDIKKDDSNLRWVLDRRQGKRGKFFDELRKDYRLRREFQNTRIILATESTENLSKKLKGIGFKVKSEK